MADHPTGTKRQFGLGYIALSVLVGLSCLWAILGFPGYEGFARTQAPPQTTVEYFGTEGALEQLGRDMVTGICSQDAVLRQRGQKILHSLTMSREEMTAVFGKDLTDKVYPAYNHGMGVFMRDPASRWRKLMGEKGAELDVNVENLSQAGFAGSVRAGETALARMTSKDLYRLNLLMGQPGKQLTIQLSNMIYLNGNWRMLGTWVSEYLVKKSEQSPVE